VENEGASIFIAKLLALHPRPVRAPQSFSGAWLARWRGRPRSRGKRGSFHQNWRLPLRRFDQGRL